MSRIGAQCTRSVGAILVAAAMLAGCIPNQGPPLPMSPLGAVQPPPDSTAKAAPVSVPPSAAGIIVRPGDTLYRIAQREGVPARALIDENGLAPPYVLQPGRTLRRPEQRFYTIQPGDSLAQIAKRFGVDMSTLVQLNGLARPYAIQSGQLLKLPAPVEAAGAGAIHANAVANLAPLPEQRALAVIAPSVPAPAAEPVSMATVASAPRSAIEAMPLAPIPATPGPPGPSIFTAPAAAAIPGPPPVAPTTGLLAPVAPPSLEALHLPQAAPHAPSVIASEPAPSPPPAKAQTAAPEPAPTSGPTRRIARGPVPEPPPRAGRTFQWPVRGLVLANFGPQPGGLHNDGMNIAAPAGTPVHAADNGVVAYAGNELRGFGNLLLIKHAGGWVSAYAHNDKLLVKRGEEVKRGQTIARVGSTGSVTQPQLHFQLRRGQHAVDPKPYLEQGQALSRAATLPPG